MLVSRQFRAEYFLSDMMVYRSDPRGDGLTDKDFHYILPVIHGEDCHSGLRKSQHHGGNVGL